jgi:nitroimidazol reductase NimA-like FMN-containing flavoprotein (pyridoxamine 5'-phosphate oxidase superfamily)
MRRKDKEIVAAKDLLGILQKCKVCRLGMQQNGQPYVVPVNFGFVFEGGSLTLYLHSSNFGKKIEILKDNNKVCFEMDTEHRLIEADTPCKYSYAFQSIVGFGVAEFIDNQKEKAIALNLLMEHLIGTGSNFVFDEKELEKVALIKIKATSFTGKYQL